jgi:hypothetical protein
VCLYRLPVIKILLIFTAIKIGRYTLNHKTRNIKKIKSIESIDSLITSMTEIDSDTSPKSIPCSGTCFKILVGCGRVIYCKLIKTYQICEQFFNNVFWGNCKKILSQIWSDVILDTKLRTPYEDEYYKSKCTTVNYLSWWCHLIILYKSIHFSKTGILLNFQKKILICHIYRWTIL